MTLKGLHWNVKERKKRREQGFIFSTVKVFTGTKLQKKREGADETKRKKNAGGESIKSGENRREESRKKKQQNKEKENAREAGSKKRK